ncbi:hypothetical protein BRARA_I02981 [Brassica rapa]|uniref:Uncharacterized protein n=1 Tax=Brassica campestris TaxID=3711 RepID=A0A397XY44_BRACM|nr:hypothetical protein BRARA_I02981 [Brassica rapa]
MDKERYRSTRDDRDRDSSADRSPEREAGRRHRDGDSKRRDSDHHRSSRREDREDERDRTRERRRSVERSEREGSRDRERSHEGSKDKETRSKRKEREEENGNKEGKKRSRFSDGSGGGGERRSRFEDESKNDQVSEGSRATNAASDVSTGVTSHSSLASETSLAPSQTLLTKVSSISTTDENKSIVRSHEVHGKSSTDGRTSGQSSSNLSLDALAKAKKAIQLGKGLADRFKKLSSANQGIKLASEGSPHARVPPSTTTPAVSAGTSSASALPHAVLPGLGNKVNIEAVKRAQEVAARMGYRQDPEFPTIINYLLGQTPAETMAVQQKPAKAPVLRVDALGREIDEHGNVISVTKPSNLSTLKVNINKQKKDAFQILKPQLEVNPEENPHFDPRMGIDKNKILRPKRMSFQFVEEGKWTRDAESLKLRSQFGEAKARELKVKQAHLAKARDDINPNLIEVSERAPRKEKPKEIIPDVEWWYAHTDRNAARKLTPAEKREKKERKLFDDPTTIETIVSVYKINKLSHPKTRFKVEMNARENRLTGCSVMTDEMSVVVVEGKSKAIKRYGKLMLRRINWAEAVKKDEKEGEEENDDEEENGGNNKCWLVWQGSVGKPSFHRFLVQECLTESAAKKVFTDAGVAHYWDLAVNYTED